MDVYFGVGGELLTPLEEMMAGDIKLSLELDLELEGGGGGLGAASSWPDIAGWGPMNWSSSHRRSPSYDLFGDKENSCLMVAPEAVIPLIKREIKHEPPPSPSESSKQQHYAPPQQNSLVLNKRHELLSSQGASSDEESRNNKRSEMRRRDEERLRQQQRLSQQQLEVMRKEEEVRRRLGEGRRLTLIREEVLDELAEDDIEAEEGSEDEEGEEEEGSEEEESESEEEEEEEQVVREIKIQPKEKLHWTNTIQSKPAILKDGSRMSYIGRQKTEIIVAKPPNNSSHVSQPPQQTVRVLHAMKKSVSSPTSSPTSHQRGGSGGQQHPGLSAAAKRHLSTAAPSLGGGGGGASDLLVSGYPKPAYSYSCLIAMALKNSVTGSLPVSEIYNFMCEHFPYFKSAPSAWKNSVRHNLSLNQCFEKIEKGGGGAGGGGNGGGSCRKGCLWAMNPDKIAKMDDEVAKWSKKDPTAIKRAMKYPNELERLVRGDLKIGAHEKVEDCDSGAEEEEEVTSEAESGSESEEPTTGKRFGTGRLSSLDSNDLGLSDDMYEELGILEEVMSSDPECDSGAAAAASGPLLKRIRLGGYDSSFGGQRQSAVVVKPV